MTLRTQMFTVTMGFVFVTIFGSPQRLAADDARSDSGWESTTLPVRLQCDQLPNLVQIHQKVISGGLPKDPAAFRQLADLGIKTIVSVDGMTPDVKMASAHGMRYVHLPHGYDGIPETRVQELAKAVRDLDGPIYIHCHHGRHRSPAAASVACVSAGLIPRELAVPILQLAGTDPNYRGLYESARDAVPLGASALDQLHVEFREMQQIPPLASAMVQLSQTDEHLQSLASAGWKPPSNHPDLDPAHQALLVSEIYTELMRTNEVARMPADFQGWIRQSKTFAIELQSELRTWQTDNNLSNPPQRISILANQISANCKACHEKYRDNPFPRNTHGKRSVDADHRNR